VCVGPLGNGVGVEELGLSLDVLAWTRSRSDPMASCALPALPCDGRQRGGFEGGGFYHLVDVDDVIVYRSGLTNLETRPAIPWNIDLGTVSAE
jgi:hypothetical protein